MLRSVRDRIQPEKGFSLIELLIVMALTGILAAIALPAFLGEQTKGQDASAKSNVRNVAAAVESCYAETKSYEVCDSLAELEATDTKPGVELTDETEKKKGAVSVTTTTDTYTIAGYSQSNNTFVMAKAADGTSSRSCTTGAGAGCGTGVW